jgi:mRNA-degrading endonuclease toxin of MazEF toxin-antitoxin module
MCLTKARTILILTAPNPTPRRGEIWTADLGEPPRSHWVVVVSLDSRNSSARVETVLIIPFGSAGAEGPTTLRLEPGETGLPSTSFLKGHFITTLKKSRLKERLQRSLSARRMREVVGIIRRAFDPDAPW